MNKHQYETELTWTGNRGKGTQSYRGYDRNFTIEMEGKQPMHGSADPAFRGDPAKYNPEELFLSSLSSCHMLWYLHLCADHQIVVTSYRDKAEAEMSESEDGHGRFTDVMLNPVVEITDSDKKDLALELHQEANKMCFIANSCNFPVQHKATVTSV